MAIRTPSPPAREANVEIPPFYRLEDREVMEIRLQCTQRDKQGMKWPQTLISIATLVASVAAWYLVGGWAGIILAGATYFLGGTALTSLYNKIRDKTYLDLSEALNNPEFLRFLSQGGFLLSIQTIVPIYQRYQRARGA